MKTSNSIYRVGDVMDAINKLRDMGYTVHIIRENVLTDDYLCEAPDDGHYNFIFEAVYLNEWSDGYKMQKCRKIPRRIWEAIEAREREFEQIATEA